MVLIDRKWNATTFPKQQKTMQRWAAALDQNPGYSLQIEVPNRSAWKATVRLLEAAGVSQNQSIGLKVVQ